MVARVIRRQREDLAFPLAMTLDLALHGPLVDLDCQEEDLASLHLEPPRSASQGNERQTLALSGESRVWSPTPLAD